MKRLIVLLGVISMLIMPGYANAEAEDYLELNHPGLTAEVYLRATFTVTTPPGVDSPGNVAKEDGLAVDNDGKVYNVIQNDIMLIYTDQSPDFIAAGADGYEIKAIEFDVRGNMYVNVEKVIYSYVYPSGDTVWYVEVVTIKISGFGKKK